MKFPFDMPERPRPDASGERVDAGMDRPASVIFRPNPERRYTVRVRGCPLVIYVPAHRKLCIDSPNGFSAGELLQTSAASLYLLISIGNGEKSQTIFRNFAGLPDSNPALSSNLRKKQIRGIAQQIKHQERFQTIYVLYVLYCTSRRSQGSYGLCLGTRNRATCRQLCRRVFSVNSCTCRTATRSSLGGGHCRRRGICR